MIHLYLEQNKNCLKFIHTYHCFHIKSCFCQKIVAFVTGQSKSLGAKMLQPNSLVVKIITNIFKSRMYIKLLHNQRLLTMFLKINLFLFLIIFLLIFFIIFLLLSSCSLFFLTPLWGLWVSLLLAWSLSEPLGESSGRSLAPFIVFLFPARFKVFSSDNFPASLIHFLSVIIRSGICSTLILGLDFIRVNGLKFKWLDSDAKGNLLLFLKLLLGLGKLLAGIIDFSSSSGFLLVSHFSLLGLLGLKHLLTLSLSLLKALLLLLLL